MEGVLHRILKEAWDYKRSDRRFLAVFDLDSTLLDLTLRVAAILDDFAENPNSRAAFPTECAALKNVQYLPSDWGLAEPLARARIPVDGTFYQALLKHFGAYFFSNDHLHRDEPLPGAVEFVQEMQRIGVDIMYLTGRDRPRMGPGTEASLRQHGFPVGNANVSLELKPDGKMDDALFKLDVLRAAESKYDRIWLFENEPVNLNLIARECPSIGLLYIESCHSGREQPSPEWSRVPHFEIDLDEFRRLR